MLNAFGIHRFCQHRTHHKGSQGAAETCLNSQQHHAEAESDGENGQRLVVEVLLELLQEGRDERDAQHKPQGDVHDQFAHLPQQFLSFKFVLHGDGRQQHHQHHGKEVFHNQNAEAHTCKAVATQSRLFYRLEHDGGRGHTEHTAQEQGVHAVQPEQMSRHHTGNHHAHHDDACANQSRAAHLQQFLERELQPEAEQEEKHTNFAPRLGVLFVVNPRFAQHVRSHQHTCHDVPQHHGLLEQFEVLLLNGNAA